MNNSEFPPPEYPAEYPREEQNPPYEPGMRPEDQPPPKVRVPDNKPDVENMTTDERMEPDPKRQDHMTPVKDPDGMTSR